MLRGRRKVLVALEILPRRSIIPCDTLHVYRGTEMRRDINASFVAFQRPPSLTAVSRLFIG